MCRKGCVCVCEKEVRGPRTPETVCVCVCVCVCEGGELWPELLCSILPRPPERAASPFY